MTKPPGNSVGKLPGNSVTSDANAAACFKKRLRSNELSSPIPTWRVHLVRFQDGGRTLLLRVKPAVLEVSGELCEPPPPPTPSTSPDVGPRAQNTPSTVILLGATMVTIPGLNQTSGPRVPGPLDPGYLDLWTPGTWTSGPRVPGPLDPGYLDLILDLQTLLPEPS